MPIYLIVVGAGSIGLSLVNLALEEGHEVTLIERGTERAHAAAQKFDVRVLHADIAQGGILEEAEADKADAIVATTSDDATNLMVMFLGREYEVKTLVSLVNVEEHQKMFKSLGVQTIVDPESIVAHHLYGRLHNTKIDGVITLDNGEQIFEATVNADSRLAGKSIGDTIEEGLFSDAHVIISVRRGDEILLSPNRDVTLQSEDHLIIFSQEPLTEAECEAFAD